MVTVLSFEAHLWVSTVINVLELNLPWPSCYVIYVTR